jgi:predicted transcriptional regulator
MSTERAKKKSKAPAQPSAEEDQQEISVSVRFPNAIIRRAEELADRMGQPGISVSRSGLLRVALLKGLDALEADKRGRRRHSGASEEEPGQLNTALRLSTSVVERIDALADRISQPGLTVSRSEAMRLAILRGLDLLEREHRA